MTGPGGREVHVDVTEQLISTTIHQLVHTVVQAMLAEGISDEVATRVCNRIATGTPDPDAVITFDPRTGDIQRASYPPVGPTAVHRPAYPTFPDGTVRPQAGG